ncbi:MAG TPA: FAD-dependent oxidoreductase [Conexibacter sp.]
MAESEYTVDVVVAGSGVAGLTAALTARAAGLEPLVLERASLAGGSSALGGGGMWVPANHFMLADGALDSPEQALAYLDALIGDDEGPSATPARRDAFVRTVPEAIGACGSPRGVACCSVRAASRATTSCAAATIPGRRARRGRRRASRTSATPCGWGSRPAARRR